MLRRTRRSSTDRLRRTTASAAFALLVALAGGVQAAVAQQTDTDSQAPVALQEDGSVELRVTNNNYQDMRVYALRDGVRHRVGTITGLTSQVIRIPKRLQPFVFGVQLLAVPIGARDGHVSPVVFPTGRDRLVWRLENNLGLSALLRFG